MAGTTRLELATSAVTGQRSNQLNYVPKGVSSQWWALKDLNLRPFGCKPNALTAELSALRHSSYSKRYGPSTHRDYANILSYLINNCRRVFALTLPHVIRNATPSSDPLPTPSA